jgi:hypothetical protein
MAATAIDRFWELVSGVLTFNPEIYQLTERLSLGDRAILLIVLLAGLSQAIGQGIVLFGNRVRPFRFVLSLVIAAVLFVFGFVFWALSTWIASRILFGKTTSLVAVWHTLGLSYAPQMLSFLIALPYLGVPIGVVLSVWSFLAFLTGLQIALGVDVWPAFWCSALGWIVFEILQRTVGRPVSAIGQWLANRAAGVPLVTNLRELEQLLELGQRQRRGNRE